MGNYGTVEGLDNLIANLSHIADNALSVTMDGLGAELEAVMADAKENYVPVDTGALRATGFVQKVDAATYEIGFGGPAVDYAVPVHENPFAHHEVGQWKYLETPLDNALPDMGARVAERALRDLGLT